MTLVLLAFALSLDAFAAAISQGARARPAPKIGDALRIGIAFGTAQGLMPLLGWALGIAFIHIVHHVDHWIAFILLSGIGVSMIREGLTDTQEANNEFSPIAGGRTLFALSIATSIDAAAAVVTLPLLNEPVMLAIALIGLITFSVCATGVFIGKLVGPLVGSRAEIFGGVVLVMLGFKILIEHLFFGS